MMMKMMSRVDWCQTTEVKVKVGYIIVRSKAQRKA